MSISTEISRIQTDRNTIRNKLVELGMAANTDNLTKLASAIEDIINRGAVSVTVKEGETYTIPAGYHNGSGTVSGVAGGGNYGLQSKTATPTKKQQNITPDSGYYGLSDVTVAAIPEAYQDVTSVTAASGDVLTGKVYVSSTGAVTTGTMPNNGKVDKTLDVTTISYTIPAGYHPGTGTVKITLEERSVTPSKFVRNIQPTAGSVLSRVIVDAIPDEYQDVTGVTATEDTVLTGYDYVDSSGEVVSGTMPNNGAVSKTLNTAPLEAVTSYTIPRGYHDGTGTVNIVPETQTITPTKTAITAQSSSGKVLSRVTVNPIPDAYQDITVVDAAAADVLYGKKIVTADGEVTTGTMANNGSMVGLINGLTETSCTIPAGYHSGTGKVSLTGDIEEALAAI